MSKYKIIILFIFIGVNAFSKQLELGISPYLWAPTSFSVTSTVTLKTNIGISDGILLTNYARIKLSKIIAPEIKIAFFNDERIIDRFSIRNNFFIHKFFSACQGYTIWNYSKYKVMEHNLFSTFQVQVPVKDFFTLIIGGGGNIKFIDYNIEEIDTSNKDIALRMAPIMKLETYFTPIRVYNFGFKISNLFDNDLNSISNFQIEMLNRIFPNRQKNWNLEINAGIGFVGSGALAGYPNQFWIAFGGTYEHLFIH